MIKQRQSIVPGVRIFCVGFLLLVGSGCVSREDATRPIVANIAGAHGFDEFDHVQSIAFTFHVQKGDHKVARSWVWKPQQDEVTYSEKVSGSKVIRQVYRRAEATSPQATDDLKAIDAKFINDSFWLLLPKHLMWAGEATITEAGKAKLPIGKGEARKIVVQYPQKGGGYTPGDRYDLYVDADYRVLQWAFHRGGAEKPTLVTTWEDYQWFAPLYLSVTRKNADGSFKLWFTDIVVERTGKGQSG